MIIPNNIGIDDASPIAKLLHRYQELFLRWWKQCGPAEYLDQTMRLRVPTGAVKGDGWAAYKSLRPDEYRWGIYAIPPAQDRIAFGEHRGTNVWKEVPSDYRELLLEHIRTQADAENASIEQSRLLTQAAPSRHDLENLFQFFLEEGRHTWAMVHLLLAHFGRDGWVEAEALLDRLSGDHQRPRLLEGFNYHTDDWLSHFLWCFLSDRVGKYQISAVTHSSFSPLAGSARFMMLEEPLHIAFGTLGLERVLCRSVQATLKYDTYDVFPYGAIPLPVIQKYINYWAPKVYDLFGNDESQRAYDLFQGGIRTSRNLLNNQEPSDVRVDARVGARLETRFVPAERAINASLRRQHMAETQKVVDRWNVGLAALRMDLQLYLPHERFNRVFGPYKGLLFDVNGCEISDPSAVASCTPTPAEFAAVKALMHRELAPGEFAAWIAPAEMTLGRLLQQPAL